MKSIFIIASVVALAAASPYNRGLVDPGVAGPVPIPESVPIAIGPTFIDKNVPIIAEPAPVFPVEEITPPVAPAPAPAPIASPVVQIILNINADGQVSVPGIVAPVAPIAPAPNDPMNIEENPPVPGIQLPVAPSEPVVIGTPELPVPVEVIPEGLN